MIEIFHQTMNASLMARLSTTNWIDELPWALLGIRTAPNEDLRTSSAEIVYGDTLLVISYLLIPKAGHHLNRFTHPDYNRFPLHTMELVLILSSLFY